MKLNDKDKKIDEKLLPKFENLGKFKLKDRKNNGVLIEFSKVRSDLNNIRALHIRKVPNENNTFVVVLEWKDGV